MNYNFLYGIPAIFLMTMVFTPAFAGNNLDIESADIFENESHISAKINVFDTAGPDGVNAYGTGVITDGTLVATTTHPGVLDSETQEGNANNPIQHNHYANLVAASNPTCTAPAVNANFQVASLSFQSPGVAMWPENMYKIWEIPKQSPPGYTNALTGDLLDYTLGALTNTGFGDYVVVSFTLVPDLGGAPPTVCVVVNEVFEAEINPLVKIGGAILQIDTVTLLASGMSTTAFWVLPVLVSAAGIGIVLVRKKL